MHLDCVGQPSAEEAGYALRSEMSSLHCTANAIRNKNPINRLFDPQYIPGAQYVPGPQFDFAYARCRARKQATKFIEPSNIVLDVSGASAAFAYMSNATVTMIDDGAAGQRVMSKPWRDGVFPALSNSSQPRFYFLSRRRRSAEYARGNSKPRLAGRCDLSL